MKPATREPFGDIAFLEQEPGLDLAIVFGSVASGRAGSDSDLDLAIYPSQPISHQSLQALADRLALASGRPVDLIDLSKAKGTLLRQIMRSGKVLFSKRPGLLGTLCERLLAWQADFEPTLRRLLAARNKRFILHSHGS